MLEGAGLRVVKFSKNQAANGFAFGDMGIAREDEGIDSRGSVGLEPGDDLIGIPDEGRTGSAPGSADSRPEPFLDESFGIGLFA